MMLVAQIRVPTVGVFGDMMNLRLTPRQFHTSSTSHGNKAKRRKLKMREMMPHIPVKKSTGVPTVQALHHFDQLYSSVFRNKWTSMRLGLMSPHKYAAIVNNAGDSEETIDELKSLGCVDIHEQFKIGFSKVEPYITFEEDGGVSVDNEAVDNLEDPETDDLMEDDEEEKFKSLDPDEASSRLMKPDQNLLGGNSVTMYKFMPTAKLKGMEDFVEESQYYESYEKIDTNFIKFKQHPKLNFPGHLRCFTFPRSDLSDFPQPRPGSLGTLNYYCLDAASLLPVLALDVRPGHSVLDLCAAPGGKSLAILQTLYPSLLTCNDIEYKRVRRLIGILDQYCGKGDGIGDMRKCVNISRQCGTQLGDFGAYDRVLVDAPCYSDRHSVTSEEGNIFVKNEIKQRLKMPEKQSELLKNGLKHLAPGGSLVYSTCTLSPVQNDGVVHKVLTELWEETSLNFEVADLDLAVKPFKFMCKIFGKREGMKYGQLVVPFLPNNFGPMYFSKINRV